MQNVAQSHTDSQETDPLLLYLLMLTCVYKRNKPDSDFEDSLISP